MAKKKQTKRHKFKYAGPATAAPVAGGFDQVEAAAPLAKSPKLSAEATTIVVAPVYAYVSRDVRRVGILAVSLIGFEVILWLVFGHTGLGNWVYSLVNVN